MKRQLSEKALIPQNVWRKILIFIFGIGFAFKFNIVGSISLSELFLIFTFPLYLFKINWEEKEIFTILALYASLFIFQLLSEIVVENALSSAMKGLAITVVSFLHFSFLYYNLREDLSLLPILIISLAITNLIIGPENILKGEVFSVDDITENLGSKVLKFYIAPIVINILLFFSIIANGKIFYFLMISISLIFIALGARSSGLLLFLTGIVSLSSAFLPKLFHPKKMLKGFLLISVFAYFFYFIYVNLVLEGKIGTGNSEQLLRCNNPYNPFELLIRGRAEVWVGWQAFMNSFFFGYGAWAYDTSGTYLHMLSKVQHLKYAVSYFDDDAYLIPSHSVIVGVGMMNGIFAFISMLCLILFFIKRGCISLLRIPARYRIVLLFFIFSLMWTAMFSPITHFRLTLPVYFASIFVLYRKYVKFGFRIRLKYHKDSLPDSVDCSSI